MSVFKDLAIVIPYYKIKFFRETLRSLADQTDKSFNVYIGNDNSPECPKEIIDEFDNKVSIYYKKFDNNLGAKSLPKQWTRCINLTKDESWILILGDDDFLGNNAVELWNKQRDNKTNLYRFSTQMFYTDKNLFSNTYLHPEYENSVDAFYRKFKGQTRSSLSEYIFKKSIYKRINFKDYPLGWYSDDKAWLDFSNKEQIKTINESTVTIRISSISISGSQDNLREKNKATVQFYKDFCLEYIGFLAIEKRAEILSFMEKLIIENNLLSPYYAYFLFKLYYKHLGFKKLSKFILKRKFFAGTLLKKLI